MQHCRSLLLALVHRFRNKPRRSRLAAGVLDWSVSAGMNEQQEDAGSLYAALNVSRDATDAEIKKSYRQLAQIYHPDKHTDPILKSRAEASFTRLQAAYEILSNESKRGVYDVYGQQGLEAGLSVVPHASNSTAELRKSWQKFQQKEAEARMQAQVSHRGQYIMRVDASNAISPYDRSFATAPELVSIVMQDHVQIPLDSDTSATIGCQAGVRKRLGFGAFICGVRRDLSPETSLETSAVLGGLKSLLTLSSTQKFGEDSSATVSATLSSPDGIALQVASRRKLSDRLEGESGVVMGMGTVVSTPLTLTYRGERFLASARLEAGLQPGALAKVQWQVREGTVARASAKAGVTGWSIEVGASTRVADFSLAGCSVTAGTQGVLVKPHFSRGSHHFEVPIIMSSSSKDPTALLIAYLGPPALSLSLHYFVLRPLRRYWKVREALQKQQVTARDVRKALTAAEGDNLLMQPVAKRQTDKEVAKGGLVIVTASYGDLDAILMEEDSWAARQQSSCEASTSSGDNSSAIFGAHWHWQGATSYEEEFDADEDPEIRAAVEAALAAQRPPPPWADVTISLRYLLRDSRIAFHEGVPKGGLMGFCDATPGVDKALRVLFFWRNKPHAATFLDLEGGELPGKGKMVVDTPLQAAMQASAHAQGLALSIPNGHAADGPVSNGPAFVWSADTLST